MPLPPKLLNCLLVVLMILPASCTSTFELGEFSATLEEIPEPVIEVDPHLEAEWEIVVDKDWMAISGFSPTFLVDIFYGLEITIIESWDGIAYMDEEGSLEALIYVVKGLSHRVLKFLANHSWIIWIRLAEDEYI